jgi:polar amino acid transport system substrate-binding protein
MKLLKFLIPSLIASIFLTGCFDKKEEKEQSSNDPNARILIVGSSIDYPPFEYFQNGKMVGFDIDLVNEIARRLNYHVKIQDMSFDAIIGALQSKRIDLAISSLSPTPARARAVDFSLLYHTSSLAVVSLETHPITQVEQLKGQKVGVQAGSIYEHYIQHSLNTQNYKIQLQQLGKIPELIQDLRSGRIIGIIMGAQEAIGTVTHQEGLVMDMIPVFDTQQTTLGQAIAFPKGSPLRKKVNEVLDAMKKDGSLQKLKNKWGLKTTTTLSE